MQSYRDLPILINQWANVVRWEMRPRLFLRTTEFLWQEGHTVHETEDEARAETKQMLDVYETFVRDHLAIPVFTGEKSESERFPGAVQTLCIEAMVQDRKAIQAGTSHFLGQNFSRSSGIQFQTRDGKQEFGWTTSWGVSTRMIGTVIMTHGDDDGLVLPPRIAPTHIVILPSRRNRKRATPFSPRRRSRRATPRHHLARRAARVHVDQRDLGGGVKNWEWIKKGVPLRVELGPRDLESGNVAVTPRGDQDVPRRKSFLPTPSSLVRRPRLLDAIQQNLFERALAFRDEHTRKIDTKEEFYDFFTPQNPAKPEIHGGFALAHWNGSRAPSRNRSRTT